MARLPRYFVPNQPQHIVQRGNNRTPTFATEDDYDFYLECLRNAAHQCGCAIHTYVLMTNHVHILATPQHQDSLPQMWQHLGRRYVWFFNKTYQRTGTLWEGRYKATVIDSDQHLLRCYRYIELNPVRAGLVADPGHYPWSSYRRHALGTDDTLVTDHALYLELGATPEARQAAYRALFASTLSEPWLTAIRHATHHGWAFGNDRFKAAIEALAQRRASPLPPGRPSSNRGLKSGSE